MNLTELNSKIADVFGKNVAGLPKYRVVWSSDEKEKRFGTFNEYYGDIFLRSHTGVKGVPKYDWLPDRWVLEKLTPVSNPELLVKVSYEPVFVLQSAKGEFLPLNYDVIVIVINALENPIRRPARTEKSDWSDEQLEFEAEKAKFRAILDAAGRSELQQKFQMKEAVVVSADIPVGDNNV